MSEIEFAREDDELLRIRLAGPWQLKAGVPSLSLVEQELASAPARRIAFDATRLTGWDSSLLMFLTRITQLCAERGITADHRGLPAGVERLLTLAQAVPERQGARGSEVDESMLERIGKATLSTTQSLGEMLRFVGEATLSVGRFWVRRARYRRSDFFVLLQEASAEALPIVTLISFLVGLILAFVGAVQLQQFGATIYVADLVSIAMAREIGAMEATRRVATVSHAARRTTR